MALVCAYMSTKSYGLMSDEAVLALLGERIARHRLNRNLTQSRVAREAGVARRTVSKLENGHVVDTRSLFRVLRALDLLDGLDTLVPPALVSPVALAQTRGRGRRRARNSAAEPEPDTSSAAEWTWPDQQP